MLCSESVRAGLVCLDELQWRMLGTVKRKMDHETMMDDVGGYVMLPLAAGRDVRFQVIVVLVLTFPQPRKKTVCSYFQQQQQLGLQKLEKRYPLAHSLCFQPVFELRRL